MKIKICGLKRLEDALVALDSGADMLGFNFYPPSPRYIKPVDCSHLVEKLRKRSFQAVLVGVFVNTPAPEIVVTLEECGLDIAQLCGDESPEESILLGERAFKALRLVNSVTLEEYLRHYPRRIAPPAWLVDAPCPGEYGGTGKSADWNLAYHLARQAPILLAGGLNPNNVAVAIRQVQPWGVDVASGVESAPGRKDQKKICAFIKAVQECEEKDVK
jgi:phosphoribosylanthranilate isomerase